ncbi:MAG: DUF1330 domain-containing protein, partial [Pseudomonadota bacterium]
MSGHLEPTDDQVRAFYDHPHTGKIWMWNLLRFKQTEQSVGTETYNRYVEGINPIVEQLGGRILNRSRGGMTFIGPDEWDEGLIIEYPSREAFLSMVQSAEYQEIVHFRQDAIEDSRLYMMTE